MGNRQTKLNILPYFEDCEHCKIPVEIEIFLQVPAINNDDKKINKIYVLCDEIFHLSISDQCSEQNDIHRVKWKPRSHMKDCETLDPFTSDEIIISKDQGIGVIILQPNMYIKLIYDKTRDVGVSCAAFSKWYHGQEPKQILSQDLGLGYNVLIVNGINQYDLCETDEN